MTTAPPSHYRSVFHPDLFKGQVHWVTGAGSGIGRCVAHELAALGATVILSGRTQEKLDRVAAEIAEDGGRCDSAAFDIRDEDAVKAGVAAVVGQARRGARPGEQRRRAVPFAAGHDQQARLRRGGGQQPDRRLPDDARAVQPEHAKRTAAPSST